MKKKASFFLFFIPLALPFLFAGVDRPVFAAAEVLIGIIFLVLLLKPIQRQSLVPPGVFPLLLLLGWIGLQLVPLPHEVLKILSPVTYEIYQDTLMVVQPDTWFCLSLDRMATIDELCRLSSYVLFYILAVQLLEDGRILPRVVFLLALLVGVVSLLAILQKYTMPGKLFWVRDAPASSMGSWFNRDHFSGFIAMLIPLVFSLFLYSKPQKLHPGGACSQVGGMVGSIKGQAQLLYGGILVLAGFVLVLGKCRATFLILPLAMVCFFLMVVWLTRKRKLSLLFAALLVVVVIVVSWGQLEPLLSRFSVFRDVEGVTQDARWLIWQDSIDMVLAFPLFGTGFNTFSSVYPGFQNSLVETFFYHAHNDVLELFIEGGMVGFFLVGWFLAVVIKSVLGAFRQQNDEYLVFVAIGSLTGMSCLILHSLVDFSFRVYANGLLFFLLCALAVVASKGKREGMSEELHFDLPSLSLKFRCGMVAVAFLLTLGGGWFHFNRLGTELSGDNYARLIGAAAEKKYVKKQGRGRRDNSSFGCLLPGWGVKKEQVKYIRKQVACFLALHPLNGDFLNTAGRWFMDAGNDSNNGEALLQAAGRYGVFRYRYRLDYADWLFSVNDHDRAVKIATEAMRLSPKAVSDAATLLHREGKSFQDIGALLPTKSLVYDQYSRWLGKQGENELAGQVAVRGLQLIETRMEGMQFNFRRVHHCLMREGQKEEALNALYLGLEYRPEDFWLHILLGDFFRDMGKIEKARKMYERAGTFRPGHAKVEERLNL